MAYEKPVEPSPQEKLAFFRHAGYKIASSKVEIGFLWLGGYDTDRVIFQGVSTQGEFLGSFKPGEVPIKWPASEIVSYKLLD